jgi:lysine 2,3-aminomutase
VIHVRRAATTLEARYDFTAEEYWKAVPAWSRVGGDQFGDHRWQERHSLTSIEQLRAVLGSRLSPGLYQDLRDGLSRTPMRLRLTPYLAALIDWANPADDPIGRQFLPLGSRFLPDHPFCQSDSLNEDDDQVAPFLVQRYPDRVLFLPLTICPVYCTFCTRSRLVGGSTAARPKHTYGASPGAWAETFSYLRTHPEIEDVVISGGDAAMLDAEVLESIGRTLIEMPHIRRVRYATRGLSAIPMKVTSDDAWVTAIGRVNDAAHRQMKEVCVHTHFNSGEEITAWTVAAAQRLIDLGIRVRNQSVLLRGVNDSTGTLHRLITRLAYIQFQPYLVYLHDMVPGCEHLRTRLSDAQRLYKTLLGTTSGFNVPRFVCDAPGGGGKRLVFSEEAYDPEVGVSAWSAPGVKPGRLFYYFDPIDLLPESGQAVWRDLSERNRRLAAFQANAALQQS